MHKFGKHTFQFKVHISPLEVVKVHWPDDGCVRYWTWMSSLEYACFGMCVHIAKDSWYLQWATPIGKKTCLLAQYLMSFHEDQTHLKASFSFMQNLNLNRSCTYLISNIVEGFMFHHYMCHNVVSTRDTSGLWRMWTWHVANLREISFFMSE